MSNDIIHAITRLFWAVDHHYWDALPKVFSEEVLLDYGEPATLTPTDIVSMWQPLFTALDAHQHLVGNHLVTASMLVKLGHWAAIMSFGCLTTPGGGSPP